MGKAVAMMSFYKRLMGGLIGSPVGEKKWGVLFGKCKDLLLGSMSMIAEDLEVECTKLFKLPC